MFPKGYGENKDETDLHSQGGRLTRWPANVGHFKKKKKRQLSVSITKHQITYLTIPVQSYLWSDF